MSEVKYLTPDFFLRPAPSPSASASPSGVTGSQVVPSVVQLELDDPEDHLDTDCDPLESLSQVGLGDALKHFFRLGWGDCWSNLTSSRSPLLPVRAPRSRGSSFSVRENAQKMYKSYKWRPMPGRSEKVSNGRYCCKILFCVLVFIVGKFFMDFFSTPGTRLGNYVLDKVLERIG